MSVPPRFLVPLLLAYSLHAHAGPSTQEPIMRHVQGTFDVKVTPQPADHPAVQSAGVGRMALDKRFHGPLEATSTGEMLYSGDGTTSGAYVAIEKVTGTLDSRSGTFVLVHHALMNRGTPEAWTVTVAPDSGTDGLKGLSGSMTITITDGKHYYDLQYLLPPE